MAQNEVDIVIRAVDEASRQLDAVRKSMDRMEGSTKRAATAAQRLQRAYKDALGPSRAMVGVVTGLGTAAIGAAGYMVRLAGQLEQTEIAFTTMLGSAEAAEQFLDNLADTAARTPFNLAGLQNASRLLLAFGFQARDTIPVISTLGDAVSAMGGGQAELQGVVRAIGQIQAKGKVSAEELMQLAERGIPAYQILQEELGLTGEQVANIGNEGISAADGINALLTGISDRFAGAMDAQSRTLLGLLSNVQDEATRVMWAVGQEITDALNLKPALEGAITGLSELRAQIEDVGISGLLASISDQAVITAGAIMGSMVPAVVNLAIVFGRATLRLAPWAVAGAVIVRTLQALGVGIDDVMPTIRRLGLAMQGVAQIIMGLVDGIAYFISATLDRFMGMVNFIDRVQGMMADLRLAVESGSMGAQDAVESLTAYVGVAWDQEFDSLPDSVSGMLASSEERLRAGGQDLVTAVTGTGDEVAAAMTPTLDIAQVVGEEAAGALAAFQGLTAGVDADLQDVVTSLQDVETAAESAGEAVRNAWGLPDAAVRGANAGEAYRISRDTDEAQRRTLPVNMPVTVEADDKTLAVLDYLAGQPDAFSDRTANMPVRLDWQEARDEAWAQALWGAGRLGETSDNVHRVSLAFTAAELRDQKWLDALMGGGGASDRLDALPVPLTWRAELDQVIFDALGDYDPAARSGTQYGTGGGIPAGATAAEIRRAQQDAAIFGVGDYDPKLRTGSQYGERGSQTESTASEGPSAFQRALTSAGDAAAAFGSAALDAARDAVPALDAAITGFAQGGPLGALAGILSSLLTESEAFQGIMERMGDVLQPVVAALTTLLDALWPIIDVALALVQAALAPLVAIIENIVAPVFTAVARLVATIWNAIASAINWALGIFGVNVRKIDLDGTAPRPRGPEEDPVERPRATGSSSGRTGDGATIGSAPPAVQFALYTPLVDAAAGMARAAEMLAETVARQHAAGDAGALTRFTTALTRATPVLDRLADGITITMAGSDGGRTAPTRLTALR